MNLFSRKLLIGILMLIVLNSCNLPAQKPQATQPITPPILQITDLPTSSIPVTGSNDAAFVQCQFCVNNEIHAVVLVPKSASFLVSQPVNGINCLTAKVVNEQRILICRGAQQVSFTLNVCLDSSDCSQLPVTLQTCPIVPQTGGVTQQAAPTIVVSPPATLTAGIPTFQSSLASPVPTQINGTRSPFTATPVSGSAPLTTPSAATLPSAVGLQDPEAFIHWYFDTVTSQRNYQELWNNYLTPSYKANVGSGEYTDYVGWWDSVERVEIQSINVLQNNGTQAMVRVYATFHMRDGRVVPSQPYDYDLFYDAARGTWIFDYRR